MANTSDSERVYLNEEDCNSIFQIPSHLVESYGVTLPSKAWLRVDGKKWRVSIEKFKDNYFFTDGWKKFAEQVNLKSLDWLKFKSASSSKENDTSKEKTRNEIGNVDGTTSSIPDEIENKDKCSRVVANLSFTKEMKTYNQSRLEMPTNFVVASEICEGEKIKLKDSEGREWPVHVTGRGRIFSLSGRWSAFIRGNKVNVGSKISFTWLSGNMLQAQIVEAGNDEQPLYSTAKNKYGKDEGEGSEKKLSFDKEIKKYHQYYMDFPKDFATSIGIRKDEKITLRNSEGREWPVRVTNRDKTHVSLCAKDGIIS